MLFARGNPMASGVTRRGDSWRARYRNPETGEVQQTFKRQAEAQRWLRDQLGAIDTGSWVDPRAGKVTLSTYFKGYAARQVWTDGTQRAMSLAVRSADFNGMELRKIRPTHGEAWVKGMTVRGLAAGTVKTRFVNVRSVFRAAMRDKVISSDPTEGVRLPRQRRADAAMTNSLPRRRCGPPGRRRRTVQVARGGVCVRGSAARTGRGTTG